MLVLLNWRKYQLQIVLIKMDQRSKATNFQQEFEHTGPESITATERKCNTAERMGFEARCEFESQLCHLLLCNSGQVIHPLKLSFPIYIQNRNTPSQDRGEDSTGLFVKVICILPCLNSIVQVMPRIRIDLRQLTELVFNHPAHQSNSREFLGYK